MLQKLFTRHAWIYLYKMENEGGYHKDSTRGKAAKRAGVRGSKTRQADMDPGRPSNTSSLDKFITADISTTLQHTILTYEGLLLPILADITRVRNR